MGNVHNRSHRSEEESVYEDLQQEIIPTDSLDFGFSVPSAPAVKKPVNNLHIPKLQSSSSVFILKKDTVKVVPVLSKFIISFEYDSEEKCSLCFKFCQMHMGLDNGVPKFSDPACQTKDIELEVGKDKKFELDYFHVSDLKNLTIESCSFRTERKFVPILIVVNSLSSNFIYYAMCGLKKELTSDWNIFVTKRRIQVGSFGYQVQEVYGLNESTYGDKVEDYKDERIKNCAICLEKPSNTILMPCRHLCLCTQCSINLTIHIGKCPMCRTCVTQILHIDQTK